MDKKFFCENNNIAYRTFQDIYAGKTKDPRISFLIAISKSLQISTNDLLFKDLEKEEVK